jgi:hypothetical protein
MHGEGFGSWEFGVRTFMLVMLNMLNIQYVNTLYVN